MRRSPFISIVLEAEILTLRRVSALLFLEGRKQRFPSLALVGGKRTLRWVLWQYTVSLKMGLPRCPLRVGWRGVRKCSGRCVGNWRGGQRISLANGVGRCLGGCVGNQCGGRWYPSARCRVARIHDFCRSHRGARTLRRPLRWTCCLGGWGRAYDEGAAGH